MAKIPNYPKLLQSAFAILDKLIISDYSASEETKHTTIEELNKHYALRGEIASASLGIVYFWDSAALRVAEVGMSEGELGIMTNTASNITDGTVGDLYQYVSSTWTLQGRLFIDGAVLTTDLDISNKELLRNQSILNQTIEPYYHFDGIDDFLLIPASTSHNDVWKYGGSLRFYFFAKTAGEASNGRLYQKGNNAVYLAFDNTIECKLRVMTSHATTNGIFVTTNYEITYNKWICLEVIHNASSVGNVPSVYIDGKPVAITTTTAPVGAYSSDSASDAYLGNRSSNDTTFYGNISLIELLNREYTKAKAESRSSNPQMAIDWVDEGGSNVAQNVSTMVNSGYDTFANGTVTGFDAIKTTTGAGQVEAGSVDEISITKGKSYLVYFSMVLNSGTAPTVDITQSLGGSSSTVGGGQLASAGVNIMTFVADETTTATLQFYSATGDQTDYEITLIDVHQLGAILYLPGRNFGPIQAKDDMNGLIATNSGATLANIDKNKQYQDEYASIADNDTIDVPAETAMLEIWINVVTLQAATTIRIGTSDGGQEVVADSAATATAGLQKLTVLISDFTAADTLYIGSDGGAAWAALDADIYVNYRIIKGLR